MLARHDALIPHEYADRGASFAARSRNSFSVGPSQGRVGRCRRASGSRARWRVSAPPISSSARFSPRVPISSATTSRGALEMPAGSLAAVSEDVAKSGDRKGTRPAARRSVLDLRGSRRRRIDCAGASGNDRGRRAAAGGREGPASRHRNGIRARSFSLRLRRAHGRARFRRKHADYA